MRFPWNKPALSAEDQSILDEARARIKAEQEKIEQQKRLETVLIRDPIDYESLLRIGRKVNAETLEIVNKDGAIVRFYFKSNTMEQSSRAEEEEIAAGRW